MVLYHRTTRTALVLNPMASWLWGLLRAPRTTGDLVASVKEQFPAVAEDRAGADIAALLDDLLRQGFVAREG